jgi:hypothetical protein
VADELLQGNCSFVFKAWICAIDILVEDEVKISMPRLLEGLWIVQLQPLLNPLSP